MKYAALLYCPDEKNSRVIARLLSELEFSVEPCAEPFAAVKQLMAQRFDAVVVDCDNDQDAALLFKSIRNSGANQSALTVSVVSGQAGVAKAFRLGANLVLTTPINVEQAKGTLRVARGLLKKNEGKAAGNAGAVSVTAADQIDTEAQQPTAGLASRSLGLSGMPNLSMRSGPGASSAFDLEAEPTTTIDPNDAALLESMPTPVLPAVKKVVATSGTGNSSATGAVLAKSAQWPDGVATREKAAPTALSAVNVVEDVPETAAADLTPAETELESVAHAPAFGIDTPSDSGSNNKVIIFAAVALLALVGGYFGWRKMTAGHAPETPSPTVAQGPDVTVTSKPLPTPATIQQVAPNKIPSASTSGSALSAKASSGSKPHETTDSGVAAKAGSDDVEDAPLMVKREGPKTTPVPSPASEDVAPPSVDIASSGSPSALAGIVGSGPSSLPKASAQTFRVSQGVSQGLLVKKVSPSYPRQAMLARTEGAVELQATIDKNGNVSSVKTIKGDKMLAAAAIDAVKQWKYKPYFLNNEPIEIQTQITVNFKLP